MSSKDKDAENAKNQISQLNAQVEELQTLMHEFRSNTQKEFTPTKANSGIGLGVSEFNPEISEKIRRLEHENADLKTQVSGETSELVDDLREKLDDSNRLLSTFESKYNVTNQSLQETTASLQECKSNILTMDSAMFKLNEQISCLKFDLAETKATLKNTVAEYEDTVQRFNEQIENDQQELEQLKQEHASSTQILHQKHIDYKNHAEELLRNSKLEYDHLLATTNEQINTLNEECQQKISISENKVIDTQQEMENALSIEKNNLANAMTHFEKEQATLIENLRVVQEEKMVPIQLALNEKTQECENAKAQLDRLSAKYDSDKQAALKKMKLGQQMLNQLKSTNAQLNTSLQDAEKSTCRLEGKLRLAEKEKELSASRVLQKQRESTTSTASKCLRSDTQVVLLRNELEQLQKAYNNLKDSQQMSTTRQKPGSVDGYLESIQQLEKAKADEENKRRETILINAKRT